MSRLIESLYPLTGAGLMSIWLWSRPVFWLTKDICQQISGVSLCLFPIFFGFVFASVSLLLSLSEQPFIKGARESGAFPLLVRYHLRCLVWCALAILLGVVIQFLPIECYKNFLTNVLLVISVGAFLATWRIVWLLVNLLKYMKFI